MGHGNHWKALFGDDFQESWAKLLPRFVQQGSLVRHVAGREISAGSEQQRWPYFALEYGEMPLHFLIVIHIDPADKLNKVQSAYPFLKEGVATDLEIVGIVKEKDEFEAELKCVTRQGTPLSFFSPLYGSDPHAFETGRKYEFTLAALAYSLKRNENPAFTLTEEPALEIEKRCRQEEDPHADVGDIKAVDFSMADLRALLFHADDADEAEFFTAVESVTYFTFEETEICKMDVRFRFRGEEDLRTSLYASAHVLAGYRPEVGDLIQGVLWLQGYPVKAIEDDASWEGRSGEDEALQNFLFPDEDLSGLHVGVAALAKTLIYGGWDLTLYENDGDNPAIPAYQIERDGRRINIWVRSYIEEQEPETTFIAEETARFQKQSRGQGCEAAWAVVVCKDVGKGYTFKILERENLEKTLGSLPGMLLYRCKDLPDGEKPDEGRIIPPFGAGEEGEEDLEEPMRRGKLSMALALAPMEEPEECWETFRTLSYEAVRAKLAVVRKERRGARRVQEFHEQELRAALGGAKGIRHPEKRRYLALAKSVYDVDFIVKAKPDFWQWLEKVRDCPHLHLDVDAVSHAIEPFYNCRWCGATVACSCRYPDGTTIGGRSNHWARREATYNNLFRDIFVRPGLCYRCRKDEQMGAAYGYGKDRIERLFWRELVEAERESWSKVRQPDYETAEQLIRANAVSLRKGNFAPAILAVDGSGVIRRILERSLRVKKILQRYGRQDTLKDILIDFVKSYCHAYNDKHNLYPLRDKMYDSDIGFLCCYSEFPYTLHLPSSYNNPDMWRSYDLERHPEKVVDLPLPFQLALLAECIQEAPLPIYYDARARAKEALAPLLQDYDDPGYDLERAMEAIAHQDMGLFLKMLVRAWERSPAAVKARKDDIQSDMGRHRMWWALREYDLYVTGAYSGFENSIQKNEALRDWLLASFPLPTMETFLKKGDIFTNVVGMRHIPWEAYLALDRYLGKGGLYLIREQDNPTDGNAILVYLEGFGITGYLKRPLAALLAPLMDQGLPIAAELFARHYPCHDQDMTLFLRLKEATAPLKTPDLKKKYRKRPVKKPEFIAVKDVSEEERALDYAKGNHDEADRWLEKDIGHDRIPEKLYDTVMYVMEAWLHGQGIALDRGNGRHSMNSQFMKAAPERLRLQVQDALSKVSLLQGQTSAFDTGWALKDRQDKSRRKWRDDAADAVKQIGTLIRLIEESNRAIEGMIRDDG